MITRMHYNLSSNDSSFSHSHLLNNHLRSLQYSWYSIYRLELDILDFIIIVKREHVLNFRDTEIE